MILSYLLNQRYSTFFYKPNLFIIFFTLFLFFIGPLIVTIGHLLDTLRQCSWATFCPTTLQDSASVEVSFEHKKNPVLLRGSVMLNNTIRTTLFNPPSFDKRPNYDYNR